MFNSFLPEHTPDLAHPLFAWIVGLLEFLFFRIEPFEVVVFCDDGLRNAIELASEVRDRFFPGPPRPERWIFRSLHPQVVPSRLFSSCVPSCHSLTGSFFLPLGWSSIRRPLFPTGVPCSCGYNSVPSS